MDWDWVFFKPSNRDKDVEDTDYHAPFSPNKEISNDGGCNGGITGLSYPHHPTQQHQKPEVLKTQNDKEAILQD